MNEVRRALERVEVPGEHEARERAWEVVRAGFAAREPAAARRPSLRPLVVLAAALAVVGAAASSPGRAVIDDVRAAIGVEEAEPALFSLPAEGRLLVTSSRGAWVVDGDGSKRLLGRYRESSWSPRARFVVASRANELVALEPDGTLRWSLARPGVRLPRWGGSETDTRIAYLSNGTLRVVAGDGTGDRRIGAALPVAPAWRPGGPPHALAYLPPDRRIVVRDVDSGRQLARTAAVEDAHQLLWAGDRLVAVTRRTVAVYDRRGRARVVRELAGRLGRAALAPGGMRMALVRTMGERSDVLVVDAARPKAAPQRVFSGAGTFSDVAWSPDGRWLLVSWRDADQWVFLRSAGVRRVEAVSRIAAQFRGDVFPTLGGWCCPSSRPGGRASLGREERVLATAPERAPASPRPSDTVSRGAKAPAVIWRRSRAVGLPWAGRLERGVRVPREGEEFLTWDPLRKRSPSPGWRRVGTDTLVRLVLDVLSDFRAAHPDAPRVAVGDLSRSEGGDFGPQWGGPGHVSHQNGLDADVYYPRLDRRERPPDRAADVDRTLAQDLVDRFVAAGAEKVFVGPNVDLHGPAGVVQPLPHHDNHLHVRIPSPR